MAEVEQQAEVVAEVKPQTDSEELMIHESMRIDSEQMVVGCLCRGCRGSCKGSGAVSVYARAGAAGGGCQFFPQLVRSVCFA